MTTEHTGLSVWIKAFIPMSIPSLTRNITRGKLKGNTAIEGPVDDWYLTDMRTFLDRYDAKARLTLGMYFDFGDMAKPPRAVSYCNVTTAVDPDTWIAEYRTGVAKHKASYIPKASPTATHEYSVMACASNPFFEFECINVSPDIDVEGTLQVDASSGKVRWKGKVDNFPAFEMYKLVGVDITRGMMTACPTEVFVRFPKPGMSPNDLWGGANNLVVTSWV